MGYVALNPDNRRVKPSQVDKPADLWCPECTEEMHIVRSHEHGESFRGRHFSHNPDQSNGCGGGESDRHVQMKQIALHKLEWEFDVAEARTEQKVGDRVADVYTRFESPHDTYGYGIIAEAQHKNKAKNIEEVTQEYLNHGYSVVWLWDEHYSKDDVSLNEGRWHSVWPENTPGVEEWTGHADGYQYIKSIRNRCPELDYWEIYFEEDETEWSASEVEFFPTPNRQQTTLPPEFADDTAQKIKEEQDWNSLFSPPVEIGDFWDFSEVPATLPPEKTERIERRVWRETDWPARFTPGHSLDIEQAEPELERPVPFASWAATDGDDSPLRLLLDVLDESADDTSTRGGFADVVCPNCSARWYYTEPHSKAGVWKACPECGSEIDFARQGLSTTEATEAVRSPTAAPVHPREYENRD